MRIFYPESQGELEFAISYGKSASSDGFSEGFTRLKQLEDRKVFVSEDWKFTLEEENEMWGDGEPSDEGWGSVCAVRQVIANSVGAKMGSSMTGRNQVNNYLAMCDPNYSKQAICTLEF